MKRLTFLLLACLLLSPSVVKAEDASKKKEDESSIEINLELFLWLPMRFEGDATTDGIELPPPNLNVDDYFSSDLDATAFWGRGEVWFGNFGVWGQGVWIDLQVELDASFPLPGLRDGPRGLLPQQASLDVDIDSEHGLVDFGGAYRLVFPLSTGKDGPKLALTLLTGASYQVLTQRVDVQLEGIGRKVTFGDTESWFEPLAGLELAFLVSSFTIGFRTEFSGFGIGEASDLTFKWIVGVTWRPVDVFSLTLAYRGMALDVSSGSGDDAFAANTVLHGPYLGFGFHF